MLQNAIRVNHRGFLPSSPKRFVLTDIKTDERMFTVYAIQNVENIPVYKGTLERVAFGETLCFIGDFSSVVEDGDYFICAGGYTSRQFVIYKGVYDICLRTMLSYFTYQRCGHDLGWNGRCHTDDGYIKETGEHVDLSGGYHQSCDLRKSPGGVSIGVLGMLRFALKDKSAWGKHLTFDEAAWACDYFAKTIQENGAMYNTLNSPFGWEGRVFYRSPAPSSAQWNATSILATGHLLFKDRDAERAERYLAAAIHSWDFMTGPDRPEGVYRHPDAFPRGMDPDYFYDQCYKDSTADLGYRIQVACDMYRATGDESFLQTLRKDVESFTACIPCDDLAQVLLQNNGSGAAVMTGGSYAWLPGGFVALCDACEMLEDSNELKKTIQTIADAFCKQAASSVWCSVRPLLTDADLDAPTGHPTPGEQAKTVRDTVTDIQYYGTLTNGMKCYTRTSNAIAVSLESTVGIFLVRASRILNEKKYRDAAQLVLDRILGVNAMDSSHIYAIGYNHAQRRAYGQFFPSTPFIPGAIGTPYDTVDAYESHSEYDMPCVGLAVYFISELANE